MIAVEAPPNARGQPSGLMSPDDLQSAEKYEVRPIDHAEEWNVYRIKTTDDLLKIKYIANQFFRLKDKYDQFGEPMYLVNGTPIVAPVLKQKGSSLTA